MRKVIHRLAAKGFCDKSGNPKPNFFYFQDPQSFSVSRISSILRGLANYYHIADSKRQCIARLSYILRHSLAMVYAAKFKLRSRAKVFAIAGKDLSKPSMAKMGSGGRLPKSRLPVVPVYSKYGDGRKATFVRRGSPEQTRSVYRQSGWRQWLEEARQSRNYVEILIDDIGL
uniref:Maturase n=1 Tax=Nitella hyalina TaxID=181804 RepID=H9LRW8_NITHY|nr:maturase [Nitella hyalina]AEH42857.1 maturase [Nitella hyalina]